MLIVIFTLFICAALLGGYLLTYLLQSKNTPKGIAFTHGAFAASGILLLLVYLFYQFSISLAFVLVLFLSAATGGFVLIYRDIFGKRLPKWLGVGHGILAIIAFIVLIIVVI